MNNIRLRSKDTIIANNLYEGDNSSDIHLDLHSITKKTPNIRSRSPPIRGKSPNDNNCGTVNSNDT